MVVGKNICKIIMMHFSLLLSFYTPFCSRFIGNKTKWRICYAVPIHCFFTIKLSLTCHSEHCFVSGLSEIQNKVKNLMQANDKFFVTFYTETKASIKITLNGVCYSLVKRILHSLNTLVGLSKLRNLIRPYSAWKNTCLQ